MAKALVLASKAPLLTSPRKRGEGRAMRKDL